MSRERKDLPNRKEGICPNRANKRENDIYDSATRK